MVSAGLCDLERIRVCHTGKLIIAARRMEMRGPLKQAGLKALKYSRGLDMLGYSPWRSRRLLILCYHGISEGDELAWRPSLYVTPEMFRWRMELLRSEQFHVLSLSEGLDRLYRRALPPRSVVITFDDGFANFTQFALPILKEYGFPATVYLTTYYSQHRWPIFPLICSYLLWKGRDRSLIMPDMGIEQTELRTLDSREIVFHRLCRFAQEQRLSGQEKDSWPLRLPMHCRSITAHCVVSAYST